MCVEVLNFPNYIMLYIVYGQKKKQWYRIVPRKRVQSPTKVRRLSADKLLSYTAHDGEG